jgi:hypothetical protein
MICEHCGQKLELGRVRKNPNPKRESEKAADDERHCGFCKMNFTCCSQGLHGRVRPS